MKTLLLLTVLSLSSCAGGFAGWTLTSPYGTVDTDSKGNIVIVPPTKPIVIHATK